MKPVIYLDMDGVLSDFVSGIHRAMGVPYDIHEWPYAQAWDFFPQTGWRMSAINRKCTTKFWANLPWMEDGERIIKVVMGGAIRPTDIAVLTRPMEHTGSYTGKAQWINRNAPLLRYRLLPTHIPKREFAREGALLIDDRQESCEEFVDAGGDAILVPRPWNSLRQMFDNGEAVAHVAREFFNWKIDHIRSTR